MLTLKDALDRNFARSLYALNFASFILLGLIVISVSYFYSKDQLEKNLLASSQAVTGYLYSQDISKISDHFNAMGSADFYTYIEVLDKNSKQTVYESSFPVVRFIPQLCRVNDLSELVNVKACTLIIPYSTFLIILLLLLGYLVLIGSTVYFVHYKTLKFFEAISDDLKEFDRSSSSISQIKEIVEIKSSFYKKATEISELSKQSALSALSRQVAHDIRSPVAVMMNVVNANKSSRVDEEMILNSLNTINEIANSLLAATKNLANKDLPKNQRLYLNKFLHELAERKEREILSKKILFNIKCTDHCLLWINPITLERVISNCWNNSLEATEGDACILEISAYQQDKVTKIHLRDLGKGFTDQFLANWLNEKIVSEKQNGNGIGLSSSIKEIKKMGGVIDFRNWENGAELILTFNSGSYLSSDTPIVVIDDDKYVRLSWENSAKNQNIKLYSFSKYKEFLVLSHEFPIETEIFIDRDLGEELKAERIIPEFFASGFKRISFETGSQPDEIEEVIGLNAILPKTFPYN